jgi:hypothetical protein
MSDSKSQHCRVVHTTDASYRSVSPLPPGYLKTLQAANQDLLHFSGHACTGAQGGEVCSSSHRR